MGAQLYEVDPHQVVLSHMAYTLLGDTLVLSTRGEHPPSAADFGQWLARLRHTDFTRILIDSNGADAKPSQRAEIAAYWNESGRTQPRVALLTDSLATRAWVTALCWLIRDSQLRAFGSRDVEDAACWLGVGGHAAELAGCIAALRAALFHRGAMSKRPTKAAAR